MTIFQEAARLAEKLHQNAISGDSCQGVSEDMAEAAKYLNAIAALDVSVEPVAVMHPKNHYCVTADLTAYRDGVPLYTQQKLEAAVLKAHDAAIEKAAYYADHGAISVTGDQIRALKCKP